MSSTCSTSRSRRRFPIRRSPRRASTMRRATSSRSPTSMASRRHYTYDAQNRKLTQATPGEPTISFTYTPTGKYLTSAAGDGTVNYSYDPLDRLTTKGDARRYAELYLLRQRQRGKHRFFQQQAQTGNRYRNIRRRTIRRVRDVRHHWKSYSARKECRSPVGVSTAEATIPALAVCGYRTQANST